MAIKELTIYVAECDGCGAEVTANAYNEPFWTESEVEAQATELGWAFTPYEDLCRECADAENDEDQEESD